MTNRTTIDTRRALRCPRCGTRLGDILEGRYETLCPRHSCKRWVVLIIKNGVVMEATAT